MSESESGNVSVAGGCALDGRLWNIAPHPIRLVSCEYAKFENQRRSVNVVPLKLQQSYLL